jgi:hypothetical protein
MMYAKIGIAIAIILAAYWKGYHDEHKRFLAFQAEVAAIGKAQELANQNAIQLSEVISEGIKDEYETRIASLRRQYAGRVCNPNSGGGQVSTVSKSSNGIDGTPSDPEFVGKCAETTAQLVALQKWITKHLENTNGSK